MTAILSLFELAACRITQDQIGTDRFDHGVANMATPIVNKQI